MSATDHNIMYLPGSKDKLSLAHGRPIDRIMKYIVFDTGVNEESVFVFPDFVSFTKMKEYLPLIISDSTMISANVILITRIISAGQMKMDEQGNIQCYGRSEELGIKSRPAVDSKLITANLSGYRQ